MANFVIKKNGAKEPFNIEKINSQITRTKAVEKAIIINKDTRFKLIYENEDEMVYWIDWSAVEELPDIGKI